MDSGKDNVNLSNFLIYIYIYINNEDRSKNVIAIYENLENKINMFYWPVENSIPKNNDRSRL
jgi:hypothetical protein